MIDGANSRRRLLRAGFKGVVAGAGIAVAGVAIASPKRPMVAAASSADDLARLAFVNTHTSESLRVVYREGPRYLTEALARIDHVLRDHRTGEVHPIDPALLDQLDRLAAMLGVGKDPYHVISGYRSPRSNSMLASRSGGVAKKSLHMEGRAIDIRIPGVPLARVHEAALDMKAGGVGYYPGSDFVHLDSGRVRNWRG